MPGLYTGKILGKFSYSKPYGRRHSMIVTKTNDKLYESACLRTVCMATTSEACNMEWNCISFSDDRNVIINSPIITNESLTGIGLVSYEGEKKPVKARKF